MHIPFPRICFWTNDLEKKLSVRKKILPEGLQVLTWGGPNVNILLQK